MSVQQPVDVVVIIILTKRVDHLFSYLKQAFSCTPCTVAIYLALFTGHFINPLIEIWVLLPG